MTNKKKFNWRSHIASIIGVTVAVAMAWSQVNWVDFDITKEWPKLLLDAIIAVGGILSKITIGESKDPQP